jgi:xylan 1,4-beta-xylosidase
MYHGYENGYRSLGRQLLLEPVSWDKEGWFHAQGGDLAQAMRMPVANAKAIAPLAWSDNFSAPAFGTRWSFFSAAPAELRRASFEGSSLLLRSKGTDPSDCTPLLGMSGDLAYECSVHVELEGQAQGALLLFFNQRLYLGMGFDGGRMITYRGGARSYWQEPAPKSRAVTFYYSVDGKQWTRHGVRSEVSGYNANTVDDLQSLRPALCAIGAGRVRFRNYRYAGLV